jgi:hypothetical protein
MKKTSFVSIVMAALVVMGCRKTETEYLFDKPADQRISEALQGYQTALTAAPGWKLFVYPKGLESDGSTDVGGFAYYMKFTDSNRVTMVSDFNYVMAQTPKESGYRLKEVQRPSLFFDTYSYIHIVSDPNAAVSQSPIGQNGTGWGSDFQFAFTEVQPKDTIILEGSQNGSEAMLVKVSAGEIDSALNKGALKSMMENISNYAAANNFIYLPLPNNKKAALSLDFRMRTLQFYYRDDNGALVTVKSDFAVTTKSIWLKQPLSIGGYTFREIFWDNQNKYFFIISNGNRVIISSEANPVISFPITTTIGKDFTTIVVPTTPLFGQSSAFADRYSQAKANIKNGGYNLDLMDMSFVFDAGSQKMTLYYTIAQNGIPYQAQTVYSYTVSGGSIKFSWVGENANAELIKNDMAPLLGIFTTDHFKLDAMATTVGLLGQFTSIETPAFYFTGYAG